MTGFNDVRPLAIPTLIRELTAVVAVVLDLDGRYCDGNQGFAFLIDRDELPAVGESVAHWFIQPSFQELASSTDPTLGESPYLGTVTLGDVRRFARSIKARMWRHGDRLLLLGEHDISELERLNAMVLSLNEEMAQIHRELVRANRQLRCERSEIRRLMMTDPLTEVANRRSFRERCAEEIERLKSIDEQLTVGALALIMADIDHFKDVNDRFGHAVGDHALIAFAEAMRDQVRADDLVARIGGEEFCVLLPGLSDGLALSVAERIRASFNRRAIEGIDLMLSASFGVAAWHPGQTVDALLGEADKALYRAKGEGRNRVALA